MGVTRKFAAGLGRRGDATAREHLVARHVSALPKSERVVTGANARHFQRSATGGGRKYVHLCGFAQPRVGAE